MNRFTYFLVVLFMLGLLLITAPVVAQRSPSEAQVPAGVQALIAGDEELRFSLHVPAYTVDTAGVLNAAGLESRTTEPGAPALPYYSTLIALPPEASASMTVQTRGDASSRLARPLAAAPRPAPDLQEQLEAAIDMEQMPRELEAVASPDPALYARDALFPETLYRLSEPMYYRDLRVVRLDLYPLRVNPARGLLEHSQQIDVRLSFEGGRFDTLHPAPTAGDRFVAALAGELLNLEQAAVWRSLPAAPEVPAAGLPIGRDSYRIAVQEDGIYEVTYAALSSAGMVMSSVNPNTLEMMYRGEPVAYQWVGDTNNTFDPGEAIRFFGWAFDGPRSEDQYVTENVFWLWAGGAPTRITTLPASAGGPQPVSFRDEITREPKRQYTGTLLDEDDWASFPNEPDAWYSEYISKTNVTPATVFEVTRTITLPNPAPGGAVTLTVELLSTSAVSPYGDVMVSMGPGMTHQSTTTWLSPRNDNVELALDASALHDGENDVRLTFFNHRTSRITYFLNRFTVAYPRLFIANDDQLIFDGEAGSRTYRVGGFTQQATPLIWEIGDRRQPRAVPAGDIQALSEGSGRSAYLFDSDITSTTFIATRAEVTKTPASISQYVAPSLDVTGGADWLAISYPAFAAPLQALAAHRSAPPFGGLRTAIVSIEDVVNQYGYGLPLPDAIRGYLAHALYNWSRPPQYVLLAGDATINPHHATCDGQNPAYNICNYWSDAQQPNYVPVHLPFKDRFQGQIPSDYPNVLLAGNDLLPDMAIGRLAVQSAAEVEAIVAKIVDYETGQLSPGTARKSIVFLADNADSAGNFCADSTAVAGLLPDAYTATVICQADNSQVSVLAARSALSAAVNYPQGAAMLNYRGHGSVFAWGDNLINSNDETTYSAVWLNNEPLVILSMDCLDGNFSFPAQPALSETFLALETVGSAAHWSSTGLGFTFEHFKLQSDFFNAAFGIDMAPVNRMGDAINYAKVQYAGSLYHESELWSFTLQGDPAMTLWRLYGYLPLVTQQ